MAVDLADLTQKVQDQITALYARGSGALGAPQVAFEPLGISVPPSSFQARPTDPGPIPALARRRVSALANQVPAVADGVYLRTEFQIDEFYQYLIFGLQSTTGAPTGPLAAMIAHARQLYEEGDIVDVLNPGDTIYPTRAEPADWYLPGSADAWTAFRFTSEPPRYLFDGTGGSATIRGTFSFDFDRGVESPAGDVFWQQSTATVRALVPKGAARLADLGTVDFDQVTPQQLMATSFSANPISGSDDATDRLQVGRVFAVLTNGGRYVKVQVQNRYQQPNSFYMLQIRYVGYVPVAAPAPHAMRTLVLRTTPDDAPAPAPTRRAWSWTLAAAPAPAPVIATVATPVARPVEAVPLVAASLRASRLAVSPLAFRPAIALADTAASAAPVPVARATRMRELLATNPQFAFARPVRVDSHAEAQADSLELSFELRAVTLHRSWMSLGILADRQWFVPGYRAGEFGERLLPAIPVTMLVARNVVVKITGRSGAAATSAVGFGPFSLAGREATVRAAAAGASESTLSAPTPQIIGWLVQPLTGLAPASDPALPPQ